MHDASGSRLTVVSPLDRAKFTLNMDI